MLKNYFKLALRNMSKHKSYSLINIFGLSIGITCCILILAYIGYEFSFDMIEGDPATALEVPFTMIITENTAKKYFGDENPVGKIMNWDNKFEHCLFI